MWFRSSHTENILCLIYMLVSRFIPVDRNIDVVFYYDIPDVPGDGSSALIYLLPWWIQVPELHWGVNSSFLYSDELLRCLLADGGGKSRTEEVAHFISTGLFNCCAKPCGLNTVIWFVLCAVWTYFRCIVCLYSHHSLLNWSRVSFFSLGLYRNDGVGWAAWRSEFWPAVRRSLRF